MSILPPCKKARQSLHDAGHDAAAATLAVTMPGADPRDLALATLLVRHKAMDHAADQALLRAAATGNALLVRGLLDLNVDPGGSFYRTSMYKPLSNALRCLDIDTITVLLEAKATVDANDFKNLCKVNAGDFKAVCKVNRATMIGLVVHHLSAKAASLCRLDFVVRNGLSDALTVLLEKKANILYKHHHHPGCLLEMAVEHSQPTCVKILLAAKATVNPHQLLSTAVKCNDVGLAKLLTRHKMTFTNRKGYYSAIDVAIESNAVNGLHWLLNRAPCRVKYSSTHLTAELSHTLQRIVGWSVGAGIVQTLLRAKAEAHDTVNGAEATLVRAIGKPDILQLLLTAKSDPNVTCFKNNPIMCRPMTLAAANLLLEAKADATARSTDGHTTLYYARYTTRYHRPMSALLRAHGAEDIINASSDLDGSDLDGSDLDGSGLDGSDLDGSDLDGSDLDGSDLDGSDLDGSGLDGSDLDGSGLDGSDLDGSGLDGSDLDGSDLDDSGR
jgi:hypothetical protein